MSQSVTAEKVAPSRADELECRWGVAVAFEMLRDGLITARDCLSLCEEAAQSVTGTTSGLAF